MGAPAARRNVFVGTVHISQAAALLAFLQFEHSRGRWNVSNTARLASLVSIDSLLRALATDLLPRLVADPASAPALLLLNRYARYIMASASAAGGTFAQGVTGVCEYFIECTDAVTPLHVLLTGSQMRLLAKEMLRRLHDLRSRRVSIASSDPGPDDDDDDSGGEEEFMALDLHLTTSLRQALQEVTDAPAADRRVFVDTIRASHSVALLGVLEFQATACNWTARNIGRVRAVTTVAGCCEALLGLLRVLITDPTHRAALTILADFAKYTRKKVGTVGGEFTEHATRMCHKLTTHGATGRRRPLPVPGLVMRRRAQQIRQDIAVFTSRDLSIAVDSGSDTISTSTSETSDATSTSETSDDTSVTSTSSSSD